MYEFHGLFTRQDGSVLELDPEAFVIKDLRPEYPFFGLRRWTRRSEGEENPRDLDRIAETLIQAGVREGLALGYATYGGPIEYLHGFELRDGRIDETTRFRPAYESHRRDADRMLEIFVEQMTAYGVAPRPTGHFAPFERGFWGE